ncbi:hypothetical protein [Mobiluncus mulieris]|uniref:hypothetical protein n=1 Tax=Mobiluncus mulieris TaxID=2052 RepID=UPI0014707FDC|nr:hypothetical protein [Mobiluncus mulieris]NMW75737.1 hypothetical protein [Mobiluncus mulieris]NMW81985.1 hypothetical protein [Mobiluncus mulieris]NMX01933.1 hypothetical protein [Mobiluncus mulieris]NMX20337.1 hypothetical protein [Mobiluncus mulieris]
MAKYIERIADGTLTQKLAGKGAVLVVGPKWCGKYYRAPHPPAHVQARPCCAVCTLRAADQFRQIAHRRYAVACSAQRRSYCTKA